MPSFNFYQYEGTGNYSWVDAYGVLLWNQPVLPISSLHWSQFTGFFIDESLIQGGNKGFEWMLWDDYSQRTTIRTRISGDVGNRVNDFSNVWISLSGALSPLTTENGFYNVSYSGAQVTGNSDLSPFNLQLSGQQSGRPLDSGWMLIQISGAQSGTNVDQSFFNARWSGETKSTLCEIPYFNTRFSGAVFPKNKDIVSINFNLSGLFYTTGGRHLTIHSGDAMSVSFATVGVIYQPAPP